MNYKPTPEDRGWQSANVGRHWTRGEYTICTYKHGDTYGYEVYRVGSMVPIGRVPSFEEAERLAERRNGGIKR